MNFSLIRDNFVSFLIPIVIVVVVFGSLLLVIMRTYFWDISSLTIILPTENTYDVQIEHQAQLVSYDLDIPFFGQYPIRVTLPFSMQQLCTNSCKFFHIPPGDGEIILRRGDDIARTLIHIDPDSEGTLNLRPRFTLVPMQPEVIEEPTIPKVFTNSTIIFKNTSQSLFLFKNSNVSYSVFDAQLGQYFTLPDATPPLAILDGADTTWLIQYADRVISWDRYGQKPTKILTDVSFRDMKTIWSNGKTRIEYNNDIQTLEGFWAPMYTANSLQITNGVKIYSVQ